jgi:hypothetical protein
MPGNSITIQLLSLTRTSDWLRSTTLSRKQSISQWTAGITLTAQADAEITDDKGAIVRFTGDDRSLAAIRMWAAAHSQSVRVLP